MTVGSIISQSYALVKIFDLEYIQAKKAWALQSSTGCDSIRVILPAKRKPPQGPLAAAGQSQPIFISFQIIFKEVTE